MRNQHEPCASQLHSGKCRLGARHHIQQPARPADDASDTKGIVEKATLTVNAFAADKDYTALPGLLAKAKAVLVYPQILEGGFVIGGSGGTGVLLVRDQKTAISAARLSTRWAA